MVDDLFNRHSNHREKDFQKAERKPNAKDEQGRLRGAVSTMRAEKSVLALTTDLHGHSEAFCCIRARASNIGSANRRNITRVRFVVAARLISAGEVHRCTAAA